MDCCILLVHHTGKVNVDNAGKIEVFDTIRGSSAIRAVCRGTLIIAADERNYRLFAENGWGKHDLAIVLDANTLEWKLLGKWEPIADGSQKDAVKAFLIQHGAATFEQIAAGLNINKKVLSEVLRRMQKSENAAEKVVKSGHRRSYSYSMALSNTIQQLDKLLDSGNSQPDGDGVLYPTKNTFSLLPPKSDHLPKSDQTGTCDALITFWSDSQELLLDKGGKTTSNPIPEPVSTIQHLSNTSNSASPETTSQQGFEATQALSNNLSNTCDPLKMVTVLSNARWFRQGSDSIPRKEIPRSLHKADKLNIDKLGTPMFEELIGDSELLGSSEDGERAKVRNLETNRISVFATKDILFLRGGSHANG